MSPLLLFRRIAIAEGVTWALLLTGMIVKYATEAHQVGELGVQVFGMVHGVVFIAYCLTTVLVSVDQRWTVGRLLLGLASAVPPFMTIWFDRYAERRGLLDARWRLVSSAPDRAVDRPVGWLLRNPVPGVLAGLVAVVALTGVALVAGPTA